MTPFCLRAAKLTNDLKDKCFLAPFSCLELCLYSPEELHGVYVCVFGVWIANGKHQTPLLTLFFSLQIESAWIGLHFYFGMWFFQFWLHAACSLCEIYLYFSLKKIQHGHSTLCYDCLICLLYPNNTVLPWDTFCFSLLWDNKSASCQLCPTAIYGNTDRKRYYCSFTAIRRNRYCHSLLILAPFSSE